MSTISSFLNASLVTASLLLAGVAHAGDATSDRSQAAASTKPVAVENLQSTGGAKPAEGKACHCATAAPKSVPERSLVDDPDFTGYMPG